MKRLSRWAKHQPVKARWIIACSRILLAALGLSAGLWLASYDLNWAAGLGWMALLGWTGATFLYPAGGGSATFYGRKWCDAILVAVSFCCYVALGNYLPRLPESPALTVRTETRTEPRVAMSSLKWNAEPPSREARRHVVQHLKKNARHLVSDMRKMRASADSGGQLLILILAVIAILGLIYLTIVLACSLSCNGQEGVALAVILLGTGAIVLVFLLARKLFISSRDGGSPQPSQG